MDPSIFATELETLALKAFGDMGHLARLRLVRDRFITGQDSCALRRHLDSVSPETPIRDIVDRCRVWESHAEFVDRRGWHPSPDRSHPVYTINDGGNAGDDLPGVADDMTPEAEDMLESLLQHLLPTPAVSPPKATPIPSELELLIQRLMGNDRPVQLAPMRRSGFTDMEVLIQNLLPVAQPTWEQPTRESGRRDWSTVVCFSCGKPGHAASRCPVLDMTFPFLPPGWQSERVGGGFVMQSPRILAERYRTATDPGSRPPRSEMTLDLKMCPGNMMFPGGGLHRGLQRLGSHRLGQLYSVFGWIVLIVVSRMVFRGCWSPYEIRGTVCRLLVVPDSWPRFVEARVPLVGIPVHCVESDCSEFCEADGNPELLGSVRDTGNSVPAAVDVVLPGMSPVMFAGTAAVSVCLPAVTGEVPQSYVVRRTVCVLMLM